MDQLYPRFSESEYHRRHTAARALMKDRGLAALLIAGGPSSPDIFYLTNYHPFMPAWVLFPMEGEPVIFHHFYNHTPGILEMTFLPDVRWYGPRPAEALVAEFRDRDLAGSDIGVVGLSAAIPYATFAAIERDLPDARFHDVARPYSEMRWIRSEEELDWLRKSARLADIACERLEEGIHAGITENDMSLLMHEGFLPEGGQLGLQFMASTPMDDPRRFVPNQYPGDRTLSDGDVVITEITIAYWGYSTQIHRPFAVGQEPNAVYRGLFEAGVECYESVLSVLKPGTTSEEIIAAGSVVEERGYEVFDSLFHGEYGKNPELGTPGSAHPFEPFTLRENQVMVIQPNPITPDHRAGLQVGAAVVITEDGAESLHDYPMTFPICGRGPRPSRDH